jgi:hypothetical protein
MADPDFPAAPEPLLWIPSDAGRPLYTSHHLKPGWRAWTAAAVIWAIAFLVELRTFTVATALAGSVIPVGIVIVGICYGLLASARFRVCERGLVMDRLYARRGAYVLPYATIDPATVRVHTHIRRIPYRYSATQAALRWKAHPLMADYVTASQATAAWVGLRRPLNIRSAPGIRYDISFRGLHPVLASPAYRAKPATRQVPARAPTLLHVWSTAAQDPVLRPVISYHGVPVIRWFIGTDHPEKLLPELERVMTAAGIPGAAGLAGRGLAQRYDEQPRTIPADAAWW